MSTRRIDGRSTAKHSRDSLPIGTIRVRLRSRPGRGGKGRRVYRTRYIKVNDGLSKSRQWQKYSRWWWEQNRGPVPDGHRVVHLDNDAMNDDPDNLACVQIADVAFLWHDRDPEGSKRNYEKLRAATAQCNRDRGQVHRALGFVKWHWYAVLHDDRIIINEPFKSRRGLLRSHGHDASINGRVASPADVPFAAMKGAQLYAEEFSQYTKIERSEFVALTAK